MALDLVPNGATVLRYVDDTIICLEQDKVVNLKMLNFMFEIMSGLTVNFQKGEILTVGGDADTFEIMSGLTKKCQSTC